MKSISLAIDDQRITCDPGTTILAAAAENGIDIPTLCHHPELKPYGACRVCLVEDQQSGRIMAACVTPVAADMAITTQSPRVINHRRNILRLMISEHPESCLVCSKGNRCRLRLLAARLGVGETGLYPMPHPAPLEQANPFIVRDLSKCILCGQCIRADHELVHTGAIDYTGRGFESRPATALYQGLEKSECTFCGTCVSVCPTGALSAGSHQYVGTPERESASICGFCGVGCSVSLGVTGNQVIDVNPGLAPGNVNGSTLCVRGHFAHDYLNSPKRLLKPLIRPAGAPSDDAAGELRQDPVSWDEALAVTADRLSAIAEGYGPKSIAFFGSSKCTNEENFLFQKLARDVLGSPHIDNGGCLHGRPVLEYLFQKTGGRLAPPALDAVSAASAILVVGADPDRSTPVLANRLKQATADGIPLIVADARSTRLMRFANISFRLPPDTGSAAAPIALINSLAAELYRQEGHDAAFIRDTTTAYTQYLDSLTATNVDRLARLAGTDSRAISATAQLLHKRPLVLIIGSGVWAHSGSRQIMDALLNLLLMTGSVKNGQLPVVLTIRENNLVGAWDMGTVPAGLPGRIGLQPGQEGLDLEGMLHAADRGELKALYVVGENPLRSLGHPRRVAAILAKLELLVVQDILETETSRRADIVLPGSAFAEKGGSYTNLEGRIQSFNPVVSPPGDARPDWQILSDLTARLDNGRTYDSVASIAAEIRRAVPQYAALDPENIQGAMSVPAGEPSSTSPWMFNPPVPVPDPVDPAGGDHYPVTALLVPHRFHLGSGTRTAASPRVGGFTSPAEALLAPQDANALALQDGDTIAITSPWGAVRRAARSDERIDPGCLHLPLAFDDNSAARLLPPRGTEDVVPGPVLTCPVRLELDRSVAHT